MTVRYNTKEAEEESFERLPPGTYLCEVEDAIEKQSSKGDPMIALRWRYIEGGFTVAWDNLVFNKGGRGIAHKKLKMMGFALPETGDVEVEVGDLIGLNCRLTLVEKEYKGKKNLTPDFDAENFGYALVDGVEPRVSKPKAAPASDATGFDEDIPF